MVQIKLYQPSQYFNHMIDRVFYIRVNEDGTKTPMMEFFPPQYNNLSHLGLDDFSKSKNVEQLLLKLKSTLLESLHFSFASDDWCIVEVNGRNSIVSNGFSEFKPYEIETNFFIKLFEDWSAFLQKFEKGEII